MIDNVFLTILSSPHYICGHIANSYLELLFGSEMYRKGFVSIALRSDFELGNPGRV